MNNTAMTDISQIKINKDDFYKLFTKEQYRDYVLKLEQEIEKLEKLTLNCYEACLCNRFETHGFDYGETHPRIKIAKGSRVNTPRALVKNSIGSEWVYKHPTKPGDSMERLKFNYIEHGNGYKSESEWKKQGIK